MKYPYPFRMIIPPEKYIPNSHFALGQILYKDRLSTPLALAFSITKVGSERASRILQNEIMYDTNTLAHKNDKILMVNIDLVDGIAHDKEGIRYLDEAIEIDPNYPNPYMAKGMAYAQMGQPRKGIPFLQKAAQLGIPQAEMAINMLEQLAQEQDQEIDNNQNEELELDFVFHSSDHLRYENGIHTSGPHGGAPRAIKVEANISGNEGYTVTMFNTDGGQANVQMAPKQMRLVGLNNEKIQLEGYGNDNFGASFADFGLTIYHNEGNIEKCILHMYDRNVDIEYLN